MRSLTFPASIHSVMTDPADHALYAGAGDGSIFETLLVGAPAQAGGSGDSGPAEGGYYTLQGGQAAVTCLSMTIDASQLVSGEYSSMLWVVLHSMLQQTVQQCKCEGHAACDASML